MRIRPRRLRLTLEQISFPLGVHMKQIGLAQAKKVSEIKHVYEVRPRKDHRGFDLISDAMPFGRLWCTKPDQAVIRVYDAAGTVIETHEHKGDFKRMVNSNGSSVLLLLVVYRPVCGALAPRTGFARADHAGFAIG